MRTPRPAVVAAAAAVIIGLIVAAVVMGDWLLGVMVVQPRKLMSTRPLNAQGFRSTRDFSESRVPGVARIAAIGDSFTAGWGVRVEDGFVPQLESALNASGKRAEVYNFGVYGASPAQEVVTLEQTALRYKPDVVVWQFFVNDIGGMPLPGAPANGVSTAVDGAGGYTYLYTIKSQLETLFPNTYELAKPALRRAVGRQVQYRRTVFNDRAYMFGQFGGLYSDDELPDIASRWTAVEETLRQAKAAAARAHADFVVLVIPAEVEIGAAYRRELDEDLLYEIDTHVANARTMHTRMNAICQRLSLDCLDPIDTFLKEDPQGDLYLRRDYHLTPRGNKLVATLLSKRLSELLP